MWIHNVLHQPEGMKEEQMQGCVSVRVQVVTPTKPSQ